MVFVGLLIAGSGYWLISYWRANLLNQRHDIFGLFTLPAVHTDLLVAGLGLGLVIGPLSSAALRVVPAAQHGIASASVVVARMTGMLIGVAALTAWGLYRFNQIVAESPVSQGSYVHAFALMYGDIFKVTVAICVVGALLGLLIGARTEHAGPDDQPVTPGQPSFEPAPATTEQPG